jgi:hypothetical protein
MCILAALEGTSLAEESNEIEISIRGDVDATRLSSAIERELGRTNVRGALARLEIVIRGRSANVRYTGEGEDVVREIALPDDADQAVETIALMAGNLARDQVSELEGRWAKPPAAQPEPREEPREEPRQAIVRAAPIVASVHEDAAPAAGDSIHRGRIGVYAMSGVGASFRGAVTAPVIVGVALRWSSVSIALEGLGGVWSSPFAGGDIALAFHRPIGRFVLGAGAAGGVVSLVDRAEPVGVTRAFVRASFALTRILDAFAEIDLAYGHGRADDAALIASAGVQVRGFR